MAVVSAVMGVNGQGLCLKKRLRMRHQDQSAARLSLLAVALQDRCMHVTIGRTRGNLRARRDGTINVFLGLKIGLLKLRAFAVSGCSWCTCFCSAGTLLARWSLVRVMHMLFSIVTTIPVICSGQPCFA